MSLPRSLEAPLIPDEKLKQLYSAMLKCRVLHEHAATEASGRAAAYGAMGAGYEAALVACAIDLEAEDVIASSHRGLIADFILNLPFGNTSGRSRRKVAANGSAAAMARCAELRTGLAMAKKMKGNVSPGSRGPGSTLGASKSAGPKRTKGNVVVTFAEINAASPARRKSASSSAGKSWSAESWAEALAVAKRDSLPIIFVQQAEIAGAGDTASHRGRNGGARLRRELPGNGVAVIPVDGNDAIAVYRVAHESIRRARQHGGPTLIECLNFRLEDGQGIDAAAGAAAEDPIARMELYLSGKGLFPRGWKSRLLRQFASELSPSKLSMNKLPREQTIP